MKKHTKYIDDDFYWLIIEDQENNYQTQIEVNNRE